METQSASLSETDLHRLKWLGGALLTLIALWSLTTIDFPGRSMVFIAIVLMGILIAMPHLPGYLPPVFWKAATPVLLFFIIADFFVTGRQGDVLYPILRMTFLLTILRGIEFRRRREDLQLLLLCLFNLVMSGVLMQDLTFAVQIAAFTPLALGYLFVLNFVEPSHARQLTLEDWKDFRWPDFAKRVGKAVDFRFLGITAILFVIFVGFSSLVFMLFPRIDLNQNIGLISRNISGVIGINDRISFGDVSALQDDGRVALRIKPPTRDAVPVRPYWRMMQLDRYGRGAFAATTIPLNDKRKRSEILGLLPALNPKTEWDFFLESGVSEYLPLLGHFTRIQFKETVVAADINRLTLKLGNIPQDVFRYTVTSMRDMDRLPATAEDKQLASLSEPIYQAGLPGGMPKPLDYPFTTLELPPANSEASRFLRDQLDAITDGANLAPPELAAEISRWLSDNFRYSLEDRTDYSKSDHPPIEWMKSASAGWCEHFAAAFTLLMRSAGVPCRTVVGFAGAEWNEYEAYLVVRNRNAHAWTEFYHDGFWIRADPTPAVASAFSNDASFSTGSQGIQAFSGVNAWLDSLRMAWYQRVIGFDDDQQTKIADQMQESAKASAQAFLDNLRQWAANLSGWLSSGWNLQKLNVVALGLLAVIGTGFALRQLQPFLLKRLGEWSPGFQKSFGDRRLRNQAGKLLKRLHKMDLHASSTKALHEQLCAIRYGQIIEPVRQQNQLDAIRSSIKHLPKKQSTRQ